MDKVDVSSVASKENATSFAPALSDIDEEEQVDATASTETVTFNVGGKIHQTSRSLIMNFQDGDTMLARLISDTWNSKNQVDDEDGAGRSPDDTTLSLFIDRDGERFRYVLDFMRYGRLVLPYNVSKELLLLDLDFFGIHHCGYEEDISIHSASEHDDDFDEGTIRYGDVPMGQELVCKFNEELKLLEIKRKNICSKLFLMKYASLCFVSFTEHNPNKSLTVGKKIKVTVKTWNHVIDTKDVALDELLEKVKERYTEERCFLQKCLEMYGLLFHWIYDWNKIDVFLLKPYSGVQ